MDGKDYASPQSTACMEFFGNQSQLYPALFVLRIRGLEL
jgi:hypothetical protein